MNQPVSVIQVSSDNDLPQSFSGPVVASPRESDSETQHHESKSTKTFEAIKSGGSKFATFLKNRTVSAADALAQQTSRLMTKPPTDPNAVSLRERAAETIGKVTVRAAEGGAWLYQASVKTAARTADEIRKLARFGSSLQWQCKVETRVTPCPRLLLQCCTALATGALQTEGIFNADPPTDEVERLAQLMGSRVVHFPADTSFHLIAALLKHHLASWPEPLLTFRLAEEWLQAGEDLQLAHGLLSQLPLANRNALGLLLGLCNAISQHALINDMDATLLATSLAPCLLWRPAVKAAATPAPAPAGGPAIMVPPMAPVVPAAAAGTPHPSVPPPPYPGDSSDSQDLPPLLNNNIRRAVSVESQLSTTDSEAAIMSALRGVGRQPLDNDELERLAQTLATIIINHASMFNT